MRVWLIGVVLLAGCSAQDLAFGLSLIAQQRAATYAAQQQQQARFAHQQQVQMQQAMDPQGWMAPRVIQPDGSVTTGFDGD
jgi:hypothetical protein